MYSSRKASENRRMGKRTMVYICGGVFLDSKERQNHAICHFMDGSGKYHAQLGQQKSGENRMIHS